jgi:protease-4
MKMLTGAVIVLLVIGVAGAMKDGATGNPAEPGKQVAVVELSGVIIDTKDIIDELYKHAADEEIQGIVLRIDSPGGAVGPSQEIFRTVRKLKERKPIVASMGSVAASGGLYASLAASKVFAEPGTLTGSIGVIMQIPNFTKVTEKLGVEMVTVKSGKFKDVGNSFREMTEEERAFLQATIETVYQQFLTDLVEGRKIPEASAREFADGRVIVGSRAKELGLVDEFGGVREAARAIFELKGQPLAPTEEPTLIYPENRFEALTKLFEASEKIAQVVDGIRPSTLQLMYLMK